MVLPFWIRPERKIGRAVVLGEKETLSEGLAGTEPMEEPAVLPRAGVAPEAGQAVGLAPQRGTEEAILQHPVTEVTPVESGEDDLRIMIGKIAGVGVGTACRVGPAAGGGSGGTTIKELVDALGATRTCAVAEEVGLPSESRYGRAEKVGSVLIAGFDVFVPEERGKVIEGVGTGITFEEYFLFPVIGKINCIDIDQALFPGGQVALAEGVVLVEVIAEQLDLGFSQLAHLGEINAADCQLDHRRGAVVVELAIARQVAVVRVWAVIIAVGWFLVVTVG